MRHRLFVIGAVVGGMGMLGLVGCAAQAADENGVPDFTCKTADFQPGSQRMSRVEECVTNDPVKPVMKANIIHRASTFEVQCKDVRPVSSGGMWNLTATQCNI